jgi:hypothetical protein
MKLPLTSGGGSTVYFIGTCVRNLTSVSILSQKKEDSCAINNRIMNNALQEYSRIYYNVKVKVKQYRYRPGVAHRVPGS